MAELRRAVAVLALVGLAAGCGSDATASKASYSAQDVRAAYYRAKDAGGGPVQQFWADPDFHSHSNYVPIGGIEACPLAQRADVRAGTKNMVQPTAGDPVQQFTVAPVRDDDVTTPTVTQGALVFPTAAIAQKGWDQLAAAIAKCPPFYDVRGGPSPILGTYRVTARPVSVAGWTGIAQQLAHTYQADDVYYEDVAHVLLHRANVILFLDFDHKKVIGDRSDAVDGVEAVAKTVVKRLG